MQYLLTNHLPETILFLFFVYVVALFNILIFRKKRVERALSNVDVAIKQRCDLIPELVEAAEKYMAYEKELIADLIEKRAEWEKAATQEERMDIGLDVGNSVGRFQGVAEDYPVLLASKNVMYLQERLAGIEDKVAGARQHYNRTVKIYNSSIQMFPYLFLAKAFKFNPFAFFEASVEELPKIGGENLC